MKCPYCGAEVGLEETVCSYCGRPNEQALRHQQDMAEYRLRYRETEAAVSRKTKHYSQIVPRVMVLLVLIIGCVITGVISESAYSMPDQSRHRAAMRNAEKTRAVLNTYLDQGDYISFSSYNVFIARFTGGKWNIMKKTSIITTILTKIVINFLSVIEPFEA